jgi:hypothetical protein
MLGLSWHIGTQNITMGPIFTYHGTKWIIVEWDKC